MEVGNKRVHDAFDELSQVYRMDISVLTLDQFLECIKAKSTKFNNRSSSTAADETHSSVPPVFKENIPPPRAPFVSKVHFTDIDAESSPIAVQASPSVAKEADRRPRFHDGVFPSFERLYGSPEGGPRGFNAQGNVDLPVSDEDDDDLSEHFSDEEEAEIDDESDVAAPPELTYCQPVSVFPVTESLSSRKRAAFQPQTKQPQQTQDDRPPNSKELPREFYSKAPTSYSVPQSVKATPLPAPEVYHFRKTEQGIGPDRRQATGYAVPPRSRVAPTEYVDLSGLTSEVIYV